MASNIKIGTNSLDRRGIDHGASMDYDDDPANTGGAANPSEISVTEINAALATKNVTVSTQSGEGETGDIAVASPVIYTNTVARSLTLNARNNIVIGANITPDTNAGALSLSFNANSSVFNPNTGLSEAASGTGHVEMGAGVSINSKGGTIGFSGSSNARHVLQGSIASGGGTINISGGGLTVAGLLSVSSANGGITIAGPIDGPGSLVLDAGTGVISAFTGAIGSVDSLSGLGLRASSISLMSGTRDVDVLAVAVGNAYEPFSWTNASALTIGTVGSVSGITTNTGTVTIATLSGDLTVSNAINTIGAAPPSGTSGNVSLTAAEDLTVSATVTGRAVGLFAPGVTTVGAVITGSAGINAGSPGGPSSPGVSRVDLGANLQTDGGAVNLFSPTRITATSVTIDTDLTADAGAGNVSFFNAVDGATAGANTLIVNAREAGSGTSGSVSFGSVGATTRLGALGVAARSVSIGGTSDIATLAIATTDAYTGVSLTNEDSLTVGAVGPVTGITTNTGNVTITTQGGDLAVASAINTIGAAPFSGTPGAVALTAANNLTVSAAITGRTVVLLSPGVTTIGAAVTGVAGMNVGSPNGPSNPGTSRIDLGANLQTDGGGVGLFSPTRITATSVTVDTDQTADAGAGNVTFFNAVDGATAGANTLIVDASEAGSGTSGSVSFNSGVGATTRLGALGVAARSVSIGGASNIGTFAAATTNAYAGISFTNLDSLTIGTVGPAAGITTNTGSVMILTQSGNLTVSNAINTIGAAPPSGSSGNISLTAANDLTVSAAVTGRAVGLFAAGVTTIGAAVSAGAGITAGSPAGPTNPGSSRIDLGATLQTDGGAVGLFSPTRITAASVTIDTDLTANAGAGNVTFFNAVDGSTAGANALIVDAREAGAGTSGSVSFNGSVGATTRLGALGVAAASLSIGAASNIGTFAAATTSAYAGISFVNADSLTIGTVGPATGITTNTGTISLQTTSGDLTVSNAINSIGSAPLSGSAGDIGLTAANNLTISAPVNGRFIGLTAAGVTTITAAVTGIAGITAGGPNGPGNPGASRIDLAGNLQTDGGTVRLNSPTRIAATTVTIDTDRTAEGNAGGVVIANTVNGLTAGANTLIVDARETPFGSGTDGTVSFQDTIGATTRLGALGVAARSVSFSGSPNDVGTLAVSLSGQNAGFSFFNAGALTIGTVGSVSGITTDTGNVTVGTITGNLTINSAIDTAGTAPVVSNGSGALSLAASGGVLTVAAPITANGVGLTGTNGVQITADIDAGTGSFSAGGATIALAGNIKTDGGMASFSGPLTLGATTVTVDTDQMTNGNAGVIQFGSINGNGLIASTLIADASETGLGTGAGGDVRFQGTVGATQALSALGVRGASVTFDTFSNPTNNVGTLAVNLTGANRGVDYRDADNLTIGEVGPASGITTNTGNVTVSAGGNLTVSRAINAVGGANANFGSDGSVGLGAGGSLSTLSAITSGGFVSLAATGGPLSIGAAIEARGNITLQGAGIGLGGNLQTDGGTVNVSNATTLSASSVTIDTDRTITGAAGNVSFQGTVEGTTAGAGTLIVDASETGNGAGGIVTFNGTIGATTALAALGVAGARVQFGSGLVEHNVGTLAAKVTGTGPDQDIIFVDEDSLVIGTVGAITGLSATGSVGISSHGDLTVGAAVSAGANVNLLSGGGVLSVNAAIAARTGLISLSGGPINLGADLRTDGGDITVSNPARLTAPVVTIDTDQLANGNAGSIHVSTIDGTTAGTQTLILDAHETGNGTGGLVDLGGQIGATTALGALGLAGDRISNNTTAENDVRLLAARFTGDNQAFVFVNRGALTIGSVGGIDGASATAGVGITAGGALVVDKAISGGIVSLTTNNGATIALNDKITSKGTVLVYGGPTSYGADISADGNVDLAGGTVTGTLVTVDSDRTIGGGAGNITVNGALNGQPAGTTAIVLDASEAGGGTGGNVTVYDIGAAARLGGFGVAGNSLMMNGATYNIGTLAANLTGDLAGIDLTNTGALTVGTVGNVSGITLTTGGAVLKTLSGDLTVSQAIAARGVSLTAAGALTVNNVALNGGTNGVFLTGNTVALGGSLQSDGASVTITGPVTLTGQLTVDTDTTSGGVAGNVTFTSSVNGATAGANTLAIDAHETNNLTGGTVSFAGAIGDQAALAGLGVAAHSVSFGGSVAAGTIAFALTGANGGIDLTSTGDLAVGSVGTISGIRTNTGNVMLAATGGLTVNQAIDTAGTALASGGSTGAVQLNATSGIALNGASGDVTTPSTYTVNADSNGDGSGTYTQDSGAAVVTAGAVKITAADVALNGTIGSGTADVTFVPSTDAATIGLEDSGQSFSLTDAELDHVATTGTIVIGSAANTGGIKIGTDAAISQDAKNFRFVTDGAIAVGANNFTTAGNVTLSAGSASTGTGIIAANALAATTRTGIALNTNAAALTLNNTTSGNIAVTNSGATSVSGANAGGEFAVTANGVLIAGAVSGTAVRLTGTGVALGGAVSTTGALELRANAGTITQTAALAAGTLTGSASGAAIFTNAGNTIGTLGAFSANGLAVVDAAGGLTVGGAVDGGTGATSIATSGNLAINATVKGTGVTLTTAGGTIQLGADIDARSGTASFQNAVALTAEATVIGNGGIAFNGAVGGAFALEASSTGTTTFGGAVSGLTALNVTSTTIALNGGSIDAATQTYTGAVSLGTNTVLTGLTPTFASTVTGNGFDLALNFSGNTAIDGANFTGVKNLSTGNGGGTTLAGTLTTSGTQNFGDAVTLGANTTLASSGAGALGNITFGSTVNATTAGVQSLTVNSAGTSTFAGAVGGTVALASLTTDAAGSTAINGGGVTTSGAQTYNDDVTLGAAASFVSTGGGTITFADTVHTDFALSVSTAGSATFTGIISGSGSFTQNGSGITTLAAATNAFTGATAVNAGTLLVEGSIAASSGVTVAAGATLGGTGTTGAVTVDDGGILAPGQATGILNTGALTLSSGAVLNIEISGASAGIGGYDQVNVTGGVSLDGAVLSASLLAPFQLSSGNTLIIINNDGADAVTGTFSGLAEGATFISGGSTYRVSYADGTGNNDVTLTALNDAPVLTAATPVLNPLGEDDTTNAGQLIADFRGSVADTDPTTTFGIAITEASDTNGHWQYQLNGAGPWIDVGIVDDAHSLLLRDQDRIRFLPDAANGTTATFSYRAWDRSVGNVEQKIDTSVNGSITAFSATENTASLTVSSLNDAPALAANAGLTLPEGGAGAIETTALRFVDVDAGSVVTYTVTTPTSHGTLFKDGIALAVNGTFTQQDIDAGLINYTHDNGETASDGFGFSVSDGIAPAITGQTFVFTVTPVNDAPVLAGDRAMTVREGDAVTLGVSDITSTDSDNTDAQLFYTVIAVSHGSVLRNGVAATSFTQTDLAAGLIAFQHDGGEADGMITLSLTDGSAPAQTATVAVAVDPHVNDAPLLGGDGTITVAEGGSVTVTTADLGATDPDNTEAQLVYTVTAQLHGEIEVGGASASSFTQADLAGGLVKFLHDGGEDDGGFEVSLTDGVAPPQTASVMAIVNPHVNDGPAPVGGTSAAVIVPENLTFVATVQAQDPDAAALTYAIAGGADQNLFNIDPSTGALTFKSAPDFEAPADANHDNRYLVDVRASDGTLSSTQTYTIDVSNVNEAPIITTNGGGATASLALIEGKTAVTIVHATDPENTAVTYGIVGGADAGKFTIDPVTGALSFITAPRFYTPTDADHDNSYVVQVSASDGSLSTVQTIAANISPGFGTPGDDTYAAALGSSRIDAGTGTDSIAFSFKLTDAAISFSGNEVTIDGPSTHTVLTGFETYVFADGVVNENDGNPLVDDLYYYANNHDVWDAHIDAEAHYNAFGWHEGRDPDAFFDTSFYLSVNQDVKASGINPLTHFDTSGWKEGRLPSPSFDPGAYLAANPDVAAANIDPLAHFLQFGYQEGRVPFAGQMIAANGFDYGYYLSHNPDVAAAGIDPYQHFETTGWKEGRNPNAIFDTSGYLATYGDVATAGINPLDHYHQFGWQEGRDPSVSFDTTSYLAAYPDVKAGGADPLVHYLDFGIHEGRSPFSDGMWG